MKKEKIQNFLKGKGFYYSLLAGLCAVFAIVFVYVGITSSKKNNQLVDLNESPITQTENMTDQPAEYAAEKDNVADLKENEQPDVQTAQTMNQTVKNKTDREVNEFVDTNAVPVTKTNQNKTEVLSFNKEDGLLWPVNGNVLMNYSMDTSIYFETLDVYKCNPAVIIEAKEDTQVLSAARGKVTKVEKNEETGLTLTMDIGSGYSLTYGQLKDVAVKEGDTIKEGTMIGKIASPTDYYLLEGDNLYFAINKDDKTVNPMLYLR